MRIALVGVFPIDEIQIRGGVQAANNYLVKGLSKIVDLEIHVLTFKPQDWMRPDRIKQDNVSIHLLPPPPRFERLRNYWTYQDILNKVLAQIQPNLVHAQEAAADAYVALRSGYPTVVTIHGIRGEDAKYYSSWSKRLRFYFDSIVIERYVMRHVRHLIAISRYVTDYFATLFRPDLKIYGIPNAINERFFTLSGASRGQVVLFAGRVTPLKRVMDLIQAFGRVVQQIPSAQFRLAGDCSTEPSYVESVRSWIRQANLGEHIHLLGELSQEAILTEFAECNLVALSSSQENAPMVIAQAMAAGKPVVATRVGGVAEMVGKGGERGVLVDVSDVEGLSAAMLRLLQDPKLQARLGQAGHAFALENYHQDRVARRTYEVYQNIVATEQRTCV